MRFKLHPMFLVFGAVYIFFGQGWVFLAYLTAVVTHEYCHLLAARSRGIPCDTITLYPFGGEIKLNYVNIPTSDEIKIALAGPLFNLTMACVFLALWWVFPETYSATQPFYYANLTTGLCNLIPVYPLDGGRVLVSLLKLKLTKYKAVLIAKIAGYVVCAAVFSAGIFAYISAKNFSFFSMAFFLFLGQRDIKTYRCTNNFVDHRKKDLLKKKGLKECIVMVHAETLLYELVTLSNRDAYYIFDVVDSSYRRLGRIEEEELYRLAEKNDIYAPVGALVSGQFARNLL